MEGVVSAANNEVVAVRNSSSFHPTVWGDYFIVNDNSPQTQETNAKWKERVEELREQVNRLFKDAAAAEHDDVLHTMELVDSIQLLGLDYHFEKEIDEALSQIYNARIDSYDLYRDSLRFRLLREHGYYIPSSIFNRIKDEEGGFIATLKDDPKGLLSLYNAAFLGTKEDVILDEVIPFAKCQLTSMLSSGHLPKSLAMQVSLALEMPLHRRVRRLLARKYIPIYEEDERRSDTILELAKLDFNLLQSLHREELRTISIWWRDLAIINSLNYTRDRLAECYYWSSAMLSAPQYSHARLIATKVIIILTITDDTYDIYSTIEDSRLLTEAIERWELEAIDALPLYLKDYYLKLINTFEGFKNELKDEEKYRVQYLIDQWKIQCRYYLEEAKWGAEKYVASVEEYLSLAVRTAGSQLLICACFVGMGDVATKEAFDWLAGFPKVMKASGLIGRVKNDLHSHHLEQKINHVASSVLCYMKEYGTGKNEACKKLQCLVDDAWKDHTKEFFRPTLVPKVLLDVVVNFSRSIEDIYDCTDIYTYSSGTMKDQITLLFVEPVPI